MLRRIGDEGVLAMVCDSTNVFVEGEAGSEATVRAKLEKLVKAAKGRVAVTCFASNVARVESVAQAAVAAGRHPVLSGRAMQRMVEAAQESGYLLDFPPASPSRRRATCRATRCSSSAPAARVSRAPRWPLANGEHRDMMLEEGDTAIFSSRVIPGNELRSGAAERPVAAASRSSPSEANIHVSGHPARDELARMYQWVRPRSPCRSTARSATWSSTPPSRGPARCRRRSWRPTAPWCVWRRARPRSSTMCLGPAGPRRRRAGAARWQHAARTAQVAVEWCAAATLVIDGKGRAVAPPKVSLRGIEDEDGKLAEAIVAGLREMLADLSSSERGDDGRIEEASRQAVRRVVRAHLGKKPLTDVHIVRI